MIDKATLTDASKISQILGQAFHDDPVMRYIMPDPGMYPVYFKTLFKRQYHRHDCSYLMRAGTGAALWLPPGIKHQDPGPLFIMNFLTMKLIFLI